VNNEYRFINMVKFASNFGPKAQASTQLKKTLNIYEKYVKYRAAKDFNWCR
jgi:hypothetical protein